MNKAELAAKAGGRGSALARHPLFRRAALDSAAGSIEVHRGGRVPSWLLGDRARALFAHRLLYHEVTRDPADPRSGILPSRVKADAVELGLCSPGRAATFLALLQMGGHLAAGPAAEDRRVRRLVPTEKLWDVVRGRMERQYAAIGHISDTARAAVGQLHDRGLLGRLVVALNDDFTSGFRVLDHAPDLWLFAERSGGLLLLYHLMLRTPEAAFPLGPVPMPLAEMSRQLGLSRTHVLRLVRDAEAAGLLRRDGDTIVPSARLGAALVSFFCAMFDVLLEGARTASS